MLDTLSAVLPALVEGLAGLSDLAPDEAPEPEDVKAGWAAFGLFIAGILAVALLGWSLVRQLRKVESARQAGVYGEPEDAADAPEAGQGEDAQRVDDQR